jgi:hypothetical protein
MSENEKDKGLVPRLRFPGFEGDVPVLPLKAITDFIFNKINISKISSNQ